MNIFTKRNIHCLLSLCFFSFYWANSIPELILLLSHSPPPARSAGAENEQSSICSPAPAAAEAVMSALQKQPLPLRPWLRGYLAFFGIIPMREQSEGLKWAMTCFKEGRNIEKQVFWNHSIFRLRSFCYLPFTMGMETTCRGVSFCPLWCSRHTCNSMTFINAIL